MSKNVKNPEGTEMTTPVTEGIVVEEPKEPTTEKKQNNTPTTGVVANCGRLNIRSEASTDAEILDTVKVGGELTITKSKSTKGWYKVKTSSGVEGFCMKDYVKIDR